MNALSNHNLFGVSPVRDTPIHEFVEEYRRALHHAALLLGGKRSADEFDRLVEDLGRSSSIGIYTWRRLDRLLRLLELDDDDVGDHDALQALAPDDPRVEEICLLTDQLRDAIDRSYPERTAA